MSVPLRHPPQSVDGWQNCNNFFHRQKDQSDTLWFARSHEWVCPHCKVSNLESLPDPPVQNIDGPSLQNPTVESANNIEPLGKGPVLVQPLVEDTMPAQLPGVPSSNDINMGNNPLPHTTEAVSTEPEASRAAQTGERTHEHIIPQQPVQQQSQAIHIPSAPPSSLRPPVLLDSAIGVLLFLVMALLLRKVF